MYDSKGRTIKEEVLTKHTPMVKKLAHQLKAKLPPNIEVDDLIQAGMIGLLDALSKYEETVQAQFETYAVQRIRGAMLDQLRENDWMPRGTRKNMKKIELVLNELQQEYSRHPTEIETAKKLNVFEEARNREMNQKFAALSAQLQFIEESYDYQSNVKGMNMEIFRSIMRTN
jgi:RNA polymerase sigma factor for flagellar operon FliA